MYIKVSFYYRIRISGGWNRVFFSVLDVDPVDINPDSQPCYNYLLHDYQENCHVIPSSVLSTTSPTLICGMDCYGMCYTLLGILLGTFT